MSEITEEELVKRRVPALIAYLTPFRIIEKDDASEPWSASIEQVNKSDWDYVALHEIIGGVDVGLESPYHMVIVVDVVFARSASSDNGRAKSSPAVQRLRQTVSSNFRYDTTQLKSGKRSAARMKLTR